MFIGYICQHIVFGLRQSCFVLKVKTLGAVQVGCRPYKEVQSGRRLISCMLLFIMLCGGTLGNLLRFGLQF